MKNKVLPIFLFVLIVIAAVYALSISKGHKKTVTPEASVSKNLIPATEITHGHGLGLDPNDTSKLYIATHHGLYLLKDEKNLFEVSRSWPSFGFAD